MAPTYVLVAVFPLQTPPQAYSQLMLACNSESLHYMALDTSGQWYQQDIDLLSDIAWQPYTLPNRVLAMAPMMVTSDSMVSTTWTPDSQAHPHASGHTTGRGTLTIAVTTKPSRITEPNAKPQLALWLGLSLGAAALCSLLTAYCCWQRQLRATRITYHRLNSVSYYSYCLDTGPLPLLMAVQAYDDEDVNKPLMEAEEMYVLLFCGS
jgi:hypothetical protein